MLCEMCGSREAVIKVEVEGTNMNVCEECSQFGKVIERIKKPVVIEKKVRKMKPVEEESVQVIVPNYAMIIRNGREGLGLSQKDFAKKINEKESLVHNIETAKLEPSMKLAEKIERFLNIRLIEEHKEKKEGMKRSGGGELTIGDLIKVKR